MVFFRKIVGFLALFYVFVDVPSGAHASSLDCVDGIAESNADSYAPSGPVTGLESATSLAARGMLSVSGTAAKLVSMDYVGEWIDGMGWSVTYGDDTITGYAACGGNGWTLAKSPYSNDSFNTSSAYAGCVCSMDGENWYFAAKLATGNDMYAKIDYCRANCPATCANMVATTKTFRDKLFNGVCPDVNVTEPDVVCNENEIKYDNECLPYKFEIQTTLDTSYFEFVISAAGTYYIDWGERDGNVQKIDIPTPKLTKISHAYMHSDSFKIRITGQAIQYMSTSAAIEPAIAFGLIYDNAADSKNTMTADKVAAISGSLGQIFSTIGDGDGLDKQPRFYRTFRECSGLTSNIPENLFDGVSGMTMEHMFYATFMDSGVTGKIPEKLFAGVSGAPVEHMFTGTFSGCSGLNDKIPGGLFENIVGETCANMFTGTFYGCSGLAGPIPENLFSGIYGAPKERMFAATFEGCKSLEGNLPSGLFGRISGDNAPKAFRRTFAGTNLLTGFVPTDLFKGINGVDSDSMFGIFENSGIWMQCPENYYRYSGYDDFYPYWDNRVSCSPCPEGYESVAGSLSIEACKRAFWECESGKWLHIGDEIQACLSETKETTPAVAVRLGDKRYYLQMTTDETIPVNKDTTRKLRMWYNGYKYNAHDASAL